MIDRSDFPRWKYHPTKDPVIVGSKEAENQLGSGWYDSPAEYGHETCPGLIPDPKIQKIKKRHEFKAKLSGLKLNIITKLRKAKA